MREYIAIDLGDGTGLLQRAGLESAGEGELNPYERAVLKLHAEAAALRAELETALRRGRRLGHLDAARLVNEMLAGEGGVFSREALRGVARGLARLGEEECGEGGDEG